VLRAVHSVLPVQYMGDLVRWSLTRRFADNAALAFAVVVASCAAGLVTRWRLVQRRD
jgi:hypothetical protein